MITTTGADFIFGADTLSRPRYGTTLTDRLVALMPCTCSLRGPHSFRVEREGGVSVCCPKCIPGEASTP